MSEHLGPIHYMMYEKICFQDEITEKLLSKEDKKELDTLHPPVKKGDLKDLIDIPNIHGWLSSRIDMVEIRLSYALSRCREYAEKMYEIGKMKAKGKKISSIDDLFSDVNMIILDGMPCDAALLASKGADESLVLKTNHDLHSKYENDSVDPNDSLDDTCEGSHDHDHHESFDVDKTGANFNQDIENKTEEYLNNAPLFYKARYYILKGFAEELGYSVTMTSNTDYVIIPLKKK